MPDSIMEKLTEYIATTDYGSLPEDMIQLAKYAVIDTVGVSLAGWREPVVKILKATYASNGQQRGEIASLWGEPTRTSIEHAALINGAASHALDFDDVAPSISAHPSAPILSAVIPLAEHLRSCGKKVITAYAIGTEVMIRIGQLMGFKHYDLAWHATDTLGTIGATAACAYLLRLNKQQIANAVAIAASMSGGLQKNFGTMTKPLHAGLAGMHALSAVTLAKNGLTANHEIFAARGFLHAFSGGYTHGEPNDIRFGQPYDLISTGLSVKKFPCCYCTHRMIQGVLDMRKAHGFTLADLREIAILTPPGGMTPLIHRRPTTGLQGKFSAEYTVLAAIVDGYVGLSSFTDEQVQRPHIQESLSIVSAAEAEGLILEGQQMDEMPVEIQIRTKDGHLYERKVLHAPGSKGQPMNREEYRAKWADCLKHAMIAIDRDKEQRVNTLFDKGLAMDSYASFSDWLSEIHEIYN